MPTAVESIASLKAVVVQLSQSSSHTTTVGDNWLFGTRDMASGLPTGQRMHKPYMSTPEPLVGQRMHKPTMMSPSDLTKVSSALQKILPANQRMIEAIGVGTDMETLHSLIDSLKAEGYHATISYFDASPRHGFSKPTAVLRAHGGAVPTVFLQQVASAMKGVPDDWL